MTTDVSAEVPPQIPTGLLLCNNLFFASKVTGTAQALGFRVDMAMTVDAAVTKFAAAKASTANTAGGYRCLLVDLGLPGLDLAALRSRLPADASPPWIAFGPHVETALFEAARAAGCVEVHPHSRFSADLAAILRRAMTG